jgi:probable rRNA maturation factor
MKINWHNLQRKYLIKVEPIESYVKDSIEFLKLDDYEINVILVGNRKIKEINKEYRNKSSETDVISFSVDLDYPDRKFLGDIYICVEVAVRQAKAYGHSVDCELAILIIHGILHLIGLDHEVDNGEMRLIEDRINERLFNIIK